jgi:subfamily B ATP-binding cassette protein MsbA
MFDKTKQVFTQPHFSGIGNLKPFIQDSLNYQLTQYTGSAPIKGLFLVIGIILLLFFLKNLFNYLAMYFITFLRNGVLKDLRNALYKKIVNLPISYFSEKRKGDVMARVTTDVLEVQVSFLSILELIVREPLTILFTILVMFLISVKLTLFVLVFIPISGLIISRIGKSLKKKSDRVQKEQGNILSILEETIGGLKIVKAFAAESKFSKIFTQATQRFFHFSNSLLNRQNLASPTSEFLGISVIGVLLWYGGKMVLIEGSLDASSFIAYMGLAYNILTPAKAISKASYGVKKGNAAAERILEILEAENPLKDSRNAISISEFKSNIQFKNIDFSYEESKVIKGIQLKVEKGQTVALVGQSGSGKSTMANLLMRFYDPQNGTVEIDNHDIKTLSISSLRKLMAFVSQDSILFNDTIKNNIALGVDKVDDEAIVEAAKVANAHEFISSLPQGYDTNIGDAGNKLSGGQKQRIAIARAILKNPPIMILDEATSALDTESEKLVQDALEKLMKNRTSLVIAHRLSTIKNADLIVVMHQGAIVESGSHQELISGTGYYQKLVSMQSLG